MILPDDLNWEESGGSYTAMANRVCITLTQGNQSVLAVKNVLSVSPFILQL